MKESSPRRSYEKRNRQIYEKQKNNEHQRLWAENPLQLVILKSLEGCIHGNDKIRKTKVEEDIYDVTTAFSPQFRTNCGHGVTILWTNYDNGRDLSAFKTSVSPRDLFRCCTQFFLRVVVFISSFFLRASSQVRSQAKTALNTRFTNHIKRWRIKILQQFDWHFALI